MNDTAFTTTTIAWRRHAGIESEIWLLNFVRNCLGYATILVPGFLLIRYYQRNRERFDLSQPPGLYKKFITLLVFGWKSHDVDSKLLSSDQQPRRRLIDNIRASKFGKHFLFAFCFIGLQFSHLIWGFYQEKMMTRDYYTYPIGDSTSSSSSSPVRERFRDSQFIVFLNRITALVLSLAYLLINEWFRRRREPDPKIRVTFEHKAPFYKYSYASLSNILSSWCQYEALKFISFPTQVVGKASKIIPTMIVGRFLHKKSYAWHQYLISAFISAGVSLFLLSRSDTGTGIRTKTPLSDTTRISGVILMCGYLLFDSFTSNWQSGLFAEYQVGEIQMMCGVNLFSTVFTLIPLLEQGQFFESIKFMSRHSDFCFDCLTTSLSTAVGQLFIFFTISEFGPVALAVIMTIRQAFAILLSCLYYGHRVSELGVLGLCLVFAALLAGQYLNRMCVGGQKLGMRRRT